MKSLSKIALFLAMAIVASAATITPTHIVSLEDWTDDDGNDTVAAATGLNFHVIGTWTVPLNLPYPDETPFPYSTANRFDVAYAIGGPVTLTFLFQQTASASIETMYMKISDGAWNPLLRDTPLVLSALAGDPVFFRGIVGTQEALYPSAADNYDGRHHFIEAVVTPEPGTLFLAFGAVLFLFAKCHMDIFYFCWQFLAGRPRR